MRERWENDPALMLQYAAAFVYARKRGFLTPGQARDAENFGRAHRQLSNREDIKAWTK